MVRRYLRVLAVLAVCTLPAGGAVPAGQPALVNIAGPTYGTQVRADTEFSEKHAGANAVDGRLEPGEGCWYSRDWTKLPCALTFQLAAEEDLRRVVLHQARWNGNMYHTRDFALETSLDGQAWTRAATGQLPDDSQAKASIDVQYHTRWLRVVILTSYNPQQTCGLTEVEILAAGHPGFGTPEIRLDGRPAPSPTAPVCGLSFVVGDKGPQVAVFGAGAASAGGPAGAGLVASVRPGEEVTVTVPLHAVQGEFTLRADAGMVDGAAAAVDLSLTGGPATSQTLTRAAPCAALQIEGRASSADTTVVLRTRVSGSGQPAGAGDAAVRWSGLRLEAGGRALPLRLSPTPAEYGSGPPPLTPSLRPALERALIEWDWRMQDGIGTERNPNTYPAAVEQVITRGDRLIADLHESQSSAPVASASKLGAGLPTAPRPAALPRALGAGLPTAPRPAASPRKLGAGLPTAPPPAASLRKLGAGLPTAPRPAASPRKLGAGLPTAPRPAAPPRALGAGLPTANRPSGDSWPQLVARWAALKQERDALLAGRTAEDAAWEDLYLRLHWLRREVALRNPLMPAGPLLFVKQVPGCFSHQLTQYYGRYARPGGGLFVLDRPGSSMACRPLAPGALPVGSTMHPEVSYDGSRILFAHCPADTTPQNTIQGHKGRYYHLYEVRADGRGLKQLTRGEYDDFAPRYLPDGKILFISTRRGGWHRCGSPGCENYTLAVAGADGSKAHSISFHETQEWDPAVMADGRVIYTRWDYVDRHPVFYEHLWTAFPDGTRPAAYFGNNTFNPIGIWEPMPIPGSRRIMATAAAHHAMTAGSIVLVDTGAGVDGPRPIGRLTPDAPFPESEAPVTPSWYSPMNGLKRVETPEARRWPGHCYRSPYPLSETYFLAAYSFQGLIGEPRGNPAGMFGLYLVDAFGNKELLYRDPNIASLWPVPIRARQRPPVLPSTLDRSLGREGIFALQDVYASDPDIPRGSVKALRIVQVLPKSTPGIDNPPVGRPRGAPGRQVLGTVPVEADGSAHFRAPAGVEMSFQALDTRGLAVQVMRSGTYLQPGERATCIGCHEKRTGSPPRGRPLALRRAPSRIVPGPDGSKPFSYPILVQPVLDKHCVACHSGPKPAGGMALTGKPEGRYTASYNALSARVPFSDLDNAEPLSRPGRFGARGSPAMARVLGGHGDTRLSAEEIERLATWMDTTALFYGTFDKADQERQQRGERIAGPQLQ